MNRRPDRRKEGDAPVAIRMEDGFDLWQYRGLGPVYPFVFVDFARDPAAGGRSPRRTVAWLTAIDEAGGWDLLGLWQTEKLPDRHFWMNVFSELRARGVEMVLHAGADCFPGLEIKRAVQWVFSFASVHFILKTLLRAGRAYLPAAHRAAAGRDLRALWEAKDFDAVQYGMERLRANWEKPYTALVQAWSFHYWHLEALYELPLPLRRCFFDLRIADSLYKTAHSVLKSKPGLAGDALMDTIHLHARAAAGRWPDKASGWPDIAPLLDYTPVPPVEGVDIDLSQPDGLFRKYFSAWPWAEGQMPRWRAT